MERKMGASLFDCLSMIDDPRQPSNGSLHDFREMQVMMIATVLSDCDTVEEMADWARMHEAWLRRFLRLKNGFKPSCLRQRRSPSVRQDSFDRRSKYKFAFKRPIEGELTLNE